MPQRALRLCAKCGTPTTGRYCAAHTNQPAIERSRFDAERRDEIRKLYGTARWRQLSSQVIAEEPICKGCGREPSTVCDHKVPARKYIAQHGGDLDTFYDRNNLQGLGKSCHDSKTAKECGFAGKKNF